ncbi:MAG: aminopeptidase P family protein [Candidatus Puniceispirillales bacterium]
MTDQRIAIDRLRQAMARADIDAYLIPRGDAFSGEEVQLCDERLAWISGFTGSAGLAIVTMDEAVLFSDGRYTIQMQNQTNETWQCKVMPGETPSGWIAAHLNGRQVGFDPMLMTMADHQKLKTALVDKNITLVGIAENLIDQIWIDRPHPLITAPWDVDPSYHGQTRTAKMKAVISAMADAGADQLLICDPTELAWLLNIRAADLSHTPVMLAFAILSHDGKVTLFYDADAPLPIDQSQIRIVPAKELIPYLEQCKDLSVWLDPAQTPIALADALTLGGANIIKTGHPLQMMKAVKNSVEQDGFRSAHCRDAVAMIRFLAWIDAEAPIRVITEIEANDKLQFFRQQVDGYLGDSFGAISASGEHGAIVHYRATRESNAPLQRNNLYLIDSGGQYHDATTDITRCIVIGAPDQDMVFCYTHVLKAHIALDRQIFPKGTTGIQLDAITRQPMWNVGLDYAHGTGHGVGCALSVHEGPVSLSPRSGIALHEGMVLSNEPGYYRDGCFGIRLENLVIVVAKDNNMLGFEHVTWVPFDRRLIDLTLLSPTEREWLNQYHQDIRDKIMPAIKGLGDAGVLYWLMAQTAPL